MHTAYIGLGSNIEPRREHILNAIRSIGEVAKVIELSDIYETKPVGFVDQPDFLNAVARVETELGAIELWQQFKSIERALGRQSRPRWHEREIDIDLLLFDDEIIDVTIDGNSLIVPHPELHKRMFVLAPLAEIAPELQHPLLGASILELWRKCEQEAIHPPSWTE